MRSLRDEYQGRVHYISYLAKSRQRLLGMQSRIHGMLQTLNRSDFLVVIGEGIYPTRVHFDSTSYKTWPNSQQVILERSFFYLNHRVE